MKKLLKTSKLCVYCLLFASCTAVKPYQRQYINDADMKMGKDAGKNFNQYVQSIREGAVPANSNKSSGGCGCN